MGDELMGWLEERLRKKVEKLWPTLTQSKQTPSRAERMPREAEERMRKLEETVKEPAKEKNSLRKDMAIELQCLVRHYCIKLSHTTHIHH